MTEIKRVSGLNKVNKEKTYEMFNRIAPTYDFLNHLLSMGQDFYWRNALRYQIKSLLLQKKEKVQILDVATGTGDLAFVLLKLPQIEKIYGIDPSLEMLQIAKKKVLHKNKKFSDRIHFLEGDALKLKDLSLPLVDAITISFGIRNVKDPKKALINFKEQLKNKGHIYILEFAYPENIFFKKLYLFYFEKVLPLLGRLISKDEKAYQYLFDSVEEFPKGEAFLNLMKESGFEKLTLKKLSFGIVHLYIGEKGLP